MAEAVILKRSMRITVRQRIERELEAIQDSNDGVLRCKDVVAFAQAQPESALHSQFMWDVERAAQSHWLQQARSLIRIHVRVLEGNNEPVRAFVSLMDDRSQEGGYRTIEAVMADPQKRAALVAQALREANAWRNRYAQLQELSSIFAEIETKTKEA